MIVVVMHGEMSLKTYELEAHVAVAAVGMAPGTTVQMALDSAFARTQNMDGSWSLDYEGNEQDRSGIVLLALLPQHDGQDYGMRSSMVGDIFVVLDDEMKGETYRVASFGFDKIK